MRMGRIFLGEVFLKSLFLPSILREKNTKPTTFPEPALLSVAKVVVVKYCLPRVVFASQKQLFYTALRQHV